MAKQAKQAAQAAQVSNNNRNNRVVNVEVLRQFATTMAATKAAKVNFAAAYRGEEATVVAQAVQCVQQVCDVLVEAGLPLRISLLYNIIDGRTVHTVRLPKLGFGLGSSVRLANFVNTAIPSLVRENCTHKRVSKRGNTYQQNTGKFLVQA